MRFVINDQLVLSRAPDGPVAPYIGAFAKSQSAQGYAPYSIYPAGSARCVLQPLAKNNGRHAAPHLFRSSLAVSALSCSAVTAYCRR